MAGAQNFMHTELLLLQNLEADKDRMEISVVSSKSKNPSHPMIRNNSKKKNFGSCGVGLDRREEDQVGDFLPNLSRKKNPKPPLIPIKGLGGPHDGEASSSVKL